MSVSNNDEDYELDYYLSIIDFYQNQSSEQEATAMWRNKSFIHLMKVLKRTRRKEFVKNAIILILSLFDDLPPDSYNNKGITPNALTNEDRVSFVNILKSEFINDIPN